MSRISAKTETSSQLSIGSLISIGQLLGASIALKIFVDELIVEGAKLVVEQSHTKMPQSRPNEKESNDGGGADLDMEIGLKCGAPRESQGCRGKHENGRNKVSCSGSGEGFELALDVVL